MKLLVLMPTKYVGNFVISLRTLEACLEQNGIEDTAIVIDDYFEPLARKVLGGSARLIFFPRRSENRLRKTLGFLRRLRDTYYDEVLDLDGTVVSGRVAFFARGARKTGPSFAKRPRSYNRIIEVDRDTQHCFDDYVQLARTVGIQVFDLRYRLFPKLSIASPLDIDTSKPVVCIHPSATKDYKQWDIEKFAALADRFAGAGWQVVVVGAGQGEADRVGRMLEAMHCTAVNAHGRLSLLELVQTLQASRLYIGNDSGPMHLAAASGIPVLGLFGPTELIRWRPRAELSQAMKGSSPCAQNCEIEDCKASYRCMTSLEVDAVIDKVRAMLGPEAL